MGVYNILKAEIDCPRCGTKGEQEIDLYFGYRNEMLMFEVGEKYVWRSGKEVQNGGRPDGGNIDGEGYVECKFCEKDFFVKVIVRDYIIRSVQIDLARKGFKA